MMYIFGKSIHCENKSIYQVIAPSKGIALEILHDYAPHIPLAELIDDYDCTEVNDHVATVIEHDFRHGTQNCKHYTDDDMDIIRGVDFDESLPF